MKGWQELNRMDLEILDAINREWQAERVRAARQERLLRGDAAYTRRGSRARVLAVALVAGLVAALLIGLAVAAASGADAQALTAWLA